MLKGRFKQGGSIKKLRKEVRTLLRDASAEAYKTARELTPVRTGYAKSQWKQTSNPAGFRVNNAVSYTEFLDKGSSSQNRKGMTKPTARKVAGFIKQRGYKVR